MLGWAVTFLIIALIAAVFGFWWHCCYCGGNREGFVLPVPSDVHNLFYFWLEGEGRPVI